jgi:poly(hydroxyalkanoate) depolymerase family esterase
MAKRTLVSIWTKALQRNVQSLTRAAVRSGTQAAKKAARSNTRAVKKALRTNTQTVVRAAAEHQKPPPGDGDWLAGIALGPAGARRYHVYRPPGVALGQRLPLLVMLHGCGQSAKDFALSTRMNRLASREKFFVLYPQQEMLANPQGCWNWYDTRSGKAYAEAATLMAAIDQCSLLYPIDRARVAVAGLSAGASMAALMATRYPSRIKAVAMHSGVAPGSAQSSAGAIGAMLGQRSPQLPSSVTAAGPAALLGSQPLPPLLLVHGGADTVVSSRNARAAAVAWAEASGAVPAAQRVVRRGDRHEMTVTDYKRRGRIAVTLCEMDALGHAWSGGDARQAFSDARGPDATRMVWAFAKRQFEPAA